MSAQLWLLGLPVVGIGWWMLGFPPGWGWLVLPIMPSMPVSAGMLLALATVVIGAYAWLAWLRTNL
jgi:fatty acid desaturase